MNNVDFILKPISNHFEVAAQTLNCLDDSFSVVSLFTYVMHSAFLQTTGCLEQKIKTIAWEMAAHDHEYRYKFLKSPLGECSSFDDKTKMFKALNKQILKLSNLLENDIEIDQAEDLKDVKKIITDTYNNLNISSSQFKELSSFNVEPPTYLAKAGLFGDNKKLKDFYILNIYRFRNRLAHNSNVNIPNLPSIRDLSGEDFNSNIFIYFSILFLIDKAFIKLFKMYKSSVCF